MLEKKIRGRINKIREGLVIITSEINSIYNDVQEFEEKINKGENKNDKKKI